MDHYSKSRQLGNWIKNELKQRGLNQEDLAKLMDVGPGQVSKIIKPKNPNYEPTIDTLEKLAKAFEIEVPELVSKISDLDKVDDKNNISVPRSFSQHNFFGRSKQITQISEAINSHRLILVTGVAGIGKTAIVRKVLKTLPELLIQKFEKPLFCRLNNAYTITDLASYISYKSNDKTDIPLRQLKLNNPITEVLESLNRKSCLLILDNLDLDHQEHGDAYNHLLEQIAETKHQSCVIVTSRSQPKYLRKWEPRPKVLEIPGLSESEAIGLLTEQGLSAESTALKSLIQKYGGNPWGLQLATQDISEKFKGDLSLYLQHSTRFAGDLHEEIYSIIQRLTERELELLYWLVLQNEAICIDDIVLSCRDRSRLLSHYRDIDTAINELHRRSLLQYHENEVILPNEVQNCAENILLREIFYEIKLVAAGAAPNKLHWLSSLDLTEAQIKLRKRFERYDSTILIQALNQLEAQKEEYSMTEIGYATANLRYLLGE
jgi:transcriptional regulator with XRE-family HTH domain